MASGPVGRVARSRSLWRFISVDPEIYPLMGVLAATFGFSGYMLGHKATIRNPEDSIKLAKDQAFPWHADRNEQGGDYKYKYHKSGDPDKEVIKAPAADIAHTALVDFPKDAAQKVSEKFGVDFPKDAAQKVSEKFGVDFPKDAAQKVSEKFGGESKS